MSARLELTLFIIAIVLLFGGCMILGSLLAK